MINRFIIFLIMRKHDLKPFQRFRFTNQLSLIDTYYFTKDRLIKETVYTKTLSNVSLNWLLNKDCEIVKVSENQWIEQINKAKGAR